VRRAVLGRSVLGVVAVLLAAGVTWAWQPAIAPIRPPAAGVFASEQVEQGAVLAAAGNCAGCHSVVQDQDWGGGLGLETGFGLAYSTNISPDPDTGIGTWSEQAFARALREGVARDGSHLFPAFPYTHYAKLTDDDVRALYAFFMSRDPVVAPARKNSVGFPFNVRILQAGWKLLYFQRGAYRDDAARSREWNRGAYLAEGITHCAGCHTPRNRLGAELAHAPYAGAPFDGWLAPPLNADNPSALPWTQADLYDYLRTGESERHGAAAGAMAGVVHAGLSRLPGDDVRALALYFADGNGSAARASGDAAAMDLAMSRRLVDVGRETQPGANLYLAACASCHYSAAPKPGQVRGSLALSTALTSDDPSNFIQTVQHGLGGAGAPGPYMPGFGTALTDADIALLATYLRATRSDRPAWTNLPARIAALRTPDASPP